MTDQVARYPRLNRDEIPMTNVDEYPNNNGQSATTVAYSDGSQYNSEWLTLFRQLDRCQTGTIPLAELKHQLESNGGNNLGLNQEERNRLFDSVDLDGDRRVDFGEFCIMMTKAKDLRGKRMLLRSAQMVSSRSQRPEHFSYLEQYNCLPPPVFMLIITIVEVAFYIYYVVTMGSGVSISGPVPTQSPLIYNPCHREEAWRYVSYMFIHIGIYHIIFNAIAQLGLGIPLELVHKFWRVGLVYVLGVLAGSLAVSVTDPRVYLAGASGGVYALIAAHAANMVVNWDEMEMAIPRLIFLVILLGTDLGVALYNRYGNTGVPDANRVSYVAHIGGFVAGLLMGIVVLRNFKQRGWERVVWWIALVGFILLVALCVLWNIFYPQYCNQQTCPAICRS